MSDPARTGLAGVVVWHTRPKPVAGGLAARCRQLGAEVICAPALNIEPLVSADACWSEAQALLDGLDHYRHVIFVSGNAVRHGLALIRSRWPHWPPPHVQCYAIGPTTARLLGEAGIEPLQAQGVSMNSEQLLQLAELAAPVGQRVVIVRGVGGRGRLGEVLLRRGASVDYLQAYRRQSSDKLPERVSLGISRETIDFITAASGDTVENIVKLVDDSLHRKLFEVKIVVPGERVAAIASNCGFTRVIPAINAGDDELIAALITASQ